MRFLLLLFPAIFLMACSSEPTLNDACDELSELCETLYVDSRCVTQRREVIMNEFYMRQERNLDRMYSQLLALEEFVMCSEKATWIEYINPANKYAQQQKTEVIKKKLAEYQARLRGKAQARLATYEHAMALLDRYVQRSSISSEPFLLYWHWSRTGNQEAINKLIALDEQGKIQNYELKYYIAQAYGNHNPDKAINSLLEGLALYPSENYTSKSRVYKVKNGNHAASDDGRLHFDIFRSLSSLYYAKGQYEQAYIFAKLLSINEDESANIPMISANIQRNKIASLDRKAEGISDALEDGIFKLSMV